MDRKLMGDLVAWKNSRHRNPMLLQGARQVGKTWLLQEFGRRNYEDTAYFSLDEETSLRDLFVATRDPDRILEELAARRGRPIRSESTLLVLDEIQESPEALASLKYFAEKRPDVHVAASGSYLGVYSRKPTSFPVGKVNFLDLRPMDFEEFLGAYADKALHDYLIDMKMPGPVLGVMFRPLLDAWVYHTIVGGMPAAVRAWVQDQDMEDCRKKQDEILLSYERDISKHVEPRAVAKVWGVWNSLPGQLARENRKFVYRLVRDGARAKDYEDAIRWIAQTGNIRLVNRIEKPGIPLSAYEDPHDFKIYFADVGLLCRKSGVGVSAWLEKEAFFTEFKGALAENYVLQALVPGFPSIGYWTSEATAEVDFVIQSGNRIVPVEVKSGQAVRSRSLGMFLEKYGLPFGIRFSTLNVDLKSPIVNLPIFLAGSLDRLLPGIVEAKTR
jgi:predicted AAA+ superfamily ATPase